MLCLKQYREWGLVADGRCGPGSAPDEQVRSGAHPPSDEAAEGWCCEHRPPALIANPGESVDPMPNPRQPDPNRIRMVLDHGEVVELDGGTLILDGQESPSVVLRLAPWRARSVARVLHEWSSVSRIFHHPTRPHLDELELSRTLELAAEVLGADNEPNVRSLRGSRVIPNRQRLAAVAVLGEREAQLSGVQRLALVDAAEWWLSEPNGGENLRTPCSQRSVLPR
ncbi:MAG: hypothetical protein QOH09_4672 [Pseudonocardiales bacterium]|nr:hypothetical protein [Pseudonocardiales bacterium]